MDRRKPLREGTLRGRKRHTGARGRGVITLAGPDTDEGAKVPPNLKLQARREATPSRIVPGRAMGRAELAEAVNEYIWRTRAERRDLDAHTIARYERGTVRWPNEEYREAFRAILHATDAELGFMPVRKRRSQGTEQTLAVNLFSPFNPETIPADYLRGVRSIGRVGWSDVDRVKTATREAASSENLHGGGSASSTAEEELRRYVPLLTGQASPTARRALFEAIGNLSGVAAFSAFDIADYREAEQRFRFALWCADTAGSWELRASTLADMARKVAYVGSADDALSLIELAQVRSDRLSATARAMLGALRAQFLSAVGRTDAALTEVARADEHFAERTPETDAPWLCYYDEAEHMGSTGKALIPVAEARRRIELAAPRIQRAVQLQSEDYPRSRTFSLTRLATLTMRLGDPSEAAKLGFQAAQNAKLFSSQRIRDELNGLAEAASAHRRIDDVAELRHVITSGTKS